MRKTRILMQRMDESDLSDTERNRRKKSEQTIAQHSNVYQCVAKHQLYLSLRVRAMYLYLISMYPFCIIDHVFVCELVSLQVRHHLHVRIPIGLFFIVATNKQPHSSDFVFLQSLILITLFNHFIELNHNLTKFHILPFTMSVR